MTNQEAFDIVAKHLLTQNAKSFREARPGCAYRGVHGLRCAVGALIPDNEYSPKFEMEPAEDVFPLVPALNGISTTLLTDLMDVHDGMPVNSWRDELFRVAQKHCLQFKE